ncbi:Probable UMP-CMP kinase 2, partial [Linum perenne]
SDRLIRSTLQTTCRANNADHLLDEIPQREEKKLLEIRKKEEQSYAEERKIYRFRSSRGRRRYVEARVFAFSISLLRPIVVDLARPGHGWNICGGAISPELLSQASYATYSLGEKNPFITFVLGGPGSGKGTQCERIAETFGFTHLSAGDLLRKEILTNSKERATILNIIKDGKIVPSELTVKLILKEMESSHSNKFLIDGFPRTEENRIAFKRIIGLEPNAVLFFDCPEEEMVKRVLNRNEGRVDDNIDTFKNRLKVFEAMSLPVIDYYSKKGKLHKINAVGDVDEIFEQARAVFAAPEMMLS